MEIVMLAFMHRYFDYGRFYDEIEQAKRKYERNAFRK